MSQGGNFNPFFPIISGGVVSGTIFLEGQHIIAYIIGALLGGLAFIGLMLNFKR